MLMYRTKDLILTGYTDSDFQTDKDVRKSTSGSIFTLNGGAVVWRSIKQTCIADHFTKALTAKVFEGHLHSLGLRCL